MRAHIPSYELTAPRSMGMRRPVGAFISLITLWTITGSAGCFAIERARANQERAILNRILQIRAALGQYEQRFGGYPDRLEVLIDQGMRDKQYAEGIGNGYYASYDVYDKMSKGKNLHSRFTLYVRPGSLALGRRLFFLDETGVIQTSKSVDDKEVEKIEAPAGWKIPPKQNPPKGGARQ